MVEELYSEWRRLTTTSLLGVQLFGYLLYSLTLALLKPSCQMTILLGQTLSDAQTLPAAPANVADQAYMNPSGLLRYLEGFYALGAPAINREALRNEQYRQLLSAHSAMHEAEGGLSVFYRASFEADQTATAEELLSRRDELIDAGYPLHQEAGAGMPVRIRVLHELEALLHDDRYEFRLLPGQADRLCLLLPTSPLTWPGC